MTTTENTSRDQQWLATYYYLSQGERWLPNGRPSVAIADMDQEWRFNAARWLERRAASFALRYSFGEIEHLARPTMVEVLGIDENGADILGETSSALDRMPEAVEYAMDNEFQDRMNEPATWIRTTALHKALVKGLPKRGSGLDNLADRAKHYAGCPQREETDDACQCAELAAEIKHEREITNGTPEWTSS